MYIMNADHSIYVKLKYKIASIQLQENIIIRLLKSAMKSTSESHGQNCLLDSCLHPSFLSVSYITLHIVCSCVCVYPVPSL